jgi:Bacterial archaeo-eukaryotic release factor family 3
MTSTLSTTHQTMDTDAIKFLAECTGPCITIHVPDHRPGAQSGSRQALWHHLVRTAGEQLTSGKFAAQAASLLAPLEELAGDPAIGAGGPGFVVFRSPDYMAKYDAPGLLTEKVMIGSHFHLTPFVAPAFAPRQFLVLGLSKKQLRLLECSNGECKEIALPAGVPASLEEAGQFNRSETDLENRSTAGPSTGSMKRVRFGTDSDREAAGEYLHDFFVLVDRGLRETLGGRRLLLAGVHEEIAAYRKAAKNGHLLNLEIQGNVDFLTPAEIGARAGHAALEHYYRLGEKVLEEWREMGDRTRALDDVRAALRAAVRGRVHRLCVRANTETIAPPLDAPHGESENLIDAAVAETLRRGGEVFVLPEDRMPASMPVTAILRY